jgi:hypothetical protein
MFSTALSNAVPLHIETWAGYYLGGSNEGRKSPAATIRRWVTYLESSNAGRPKSYAICNIAGHPCNSVAYVDTNNQYFGSCGWSDAVVNNGLSQQRPLPESAWLHASADLSYDNRLFNNYSAKCVPRTNDTGLWVNRKSDAASRYFNAYFQRQFGSSVPDYYFDDDTTLINVFGGRQAYEYGSWRDLERAQAHWLGAERNRYGRAQNLFFNGCNNNPYIVPGTGLVKSKPNIDGCVSEGNVSSANISNGRDLYALDNCARVSLNRNGGIFVNGINGESNTAAYRIQVMAFTWLCYVPGRVVTWLDPEGGDFVNVFPEEGIYPARPVQSMRFPSGCPDATISARGAGNDASSGDPCSVHGHNDLLLGGVTNVLRREFHACYNQGKPVGPCAVIWNMGETPVTLTPQWFTQRYRHKLTITGGTIDEGGRVSFTPLGRGEPIAPYEALLLVR